MDTISQKHLLILEPEEVLRTFQHPHLPNRCDIETNIYLGVDLAKRINY